MLDVSVAVDDDILHLLCRCTLRAIDVLVAVGQEIVDDRLEVGRVQIIGVG